MHSLSGYANALSVTNPLRVTSTLFLRAFTKLVAHVDTRMPQLGTSPNGHFDPVLELFSPPLHNSVHLALAARPNREYLY